MAIRTTTRLRNPALTKADHDTLEHAVWLRERGLGIFPRGGSQHRHFAKLVDRGYLDYVGDGVDDDDHMHEVSLHAITDAGYRAIHRSPPRPKRTWGEYTWPTWVPLELRAEIERFWYDGPDAWEENAASPYNNAAAFGERVTMMLVCSTKESATGRFVHAWNNIGRLVRDDGSVVMVRNGSRLDAILSEPETALA